MQFLQAIDGNKTYLCSIFAGLLATIHFIVVGDFSWAAVSQYAQSDVIIAAIAALRHGISKIQPTGNGGNITKGA